MTLKEKSIANSRLLLDPIKLAQNVGLRFSLQKQVVTDETYFKALKIFFTELSEFIDKGVIVEINGERVIG